MIWGSKCHQNNFPVVCDGYVKYEEAEVDRLVAILKTNNCGGGGPCGIQWAARLWLLGYEFNLLHHVGLVAKRLRATAHEGDDNTINRPFGSFFLCYRTY